MEHAERELLNLLSVSGGNLYDMLAKANGLIETNIPNTWVKNELEDKNDLVKTTYTLTKLGFKVKHEHKPPKTKRIFPLFSWLLFSS